MNTNKGIFSLIGFLLTGIGFLAIILSIVGVQLSFLTWLDTFGALWSFLAKLLMIVVGLLTIYLTLSDFTGENGG